MAEEKSDAEKAQELAERLERDYPESVILGDDNPSIIGRFVRVDSGPSDYGPVPIFVIEGKDGKEYGLWGFHAVLRSQFATKKPKPGELVGIRYLGEKMGQRGTSYKNYRVEAWAQDGNQEVDWSLIDPSGSMPDQPWAEPSDVPVSIPLDVPPKTPAEKIVAQQGQGWDGWT